MDVSERSWLRDFAILAAVSRIKAGNKLGEPEFYLTNPDTEIKYAVYPLLRENDIYRIRICVTPEGRVCVLKVAASIDRNSVIDREAYVLQKLYREDHAPDEATQTRAFFPEVVASFNAGPEQGNRVVEVLGFASVVSHVNQLELLEDIIGVQNLRVDAKTASWIWGKLLKVIGYAHNLGIINGAIETTNVLLETSMHGVVVFDWSYARFSQSIEDQQAEIRKAAKAILSALDVTVDGRLPGRDEHLTYEQQTEFENYFRRIIDGDTRGESAYELKDMFYDMILRFWEREFYPFTAYEKKKKE